MRDSFGRFAEMGDEGLVGAGAELAKRMLDQLANGDGLNTRELSVLRASVSLTMKVAELKYARHRLVNLLDFNTPR